VRRGLIATLIALSLVAAAPVVAATSATTATLPVRLARALAVPNVTPAATGAVAIDLLTGQTVFAEHPDTPLAPASNEKLAVTYTALQELGPSYRFRTDVLGTGHREGPVWHGNLVLKGFGDPTLTSQGLAKLAVLLKAQGIRRVTGRVLGDESWFDALRTAAGWKPSFYVLESAPLSALVVDRDWYDKHYATRPAVAAAGRFKQVLAANGVVVDGPVGQGVASANGVPLAEVLSQPLRTILRFMDRDSDNFTAEMLLKEIAAETHPGTAGDGTTAAGAAVVQRDLAAAGVPLAGVRIVDGSGLSSSDRLTAGALGALLVLAWRDPAMRPVVWAALPVAGENGTLDDRMEKRPARGVVRAKTGTTDLASALSGYAGTRFAFAVIQNGQPVSWTWARTAQDRFATVLASAAR
jgi:D-alanyl-D-alanine carboxypeptidase/D-alanyl-D-alanine-endopeptidase (penicillin-binding protein 4)